MLYLGLLQTGLYHNAHNPRKYTKIFPNWNHVLAFILQFVEKRHSCRALCVGATSHCYGQRGCIKRRAEAVVSYSTKRLCPLPYANSSWRVLIVIEPLQKVGCAATTYNYLLVCAGVELQFKACSKMLRYILDGVNRYYAAARDAEERFWVEHLLHRVERVVE